MLLGHKTQWNFLKNSIQKGKISQSFLFWGPSRIGKKTFAIEFAKLLNCKKKKTEKKPCQKCQNCKEIEKRKFLDLILIQPQKKEISIETVRELLWQMSLKPYLGKYKIAILDNAHFLTKVSQNALLKTIEEPKERSIFILVTEYPFKLLPTLRSRLQEIHFFYLSEKEIEEFLKKENLPSQKIKEILEFSHQRPGIAIELLKDPSKIDFLRKKIQKLREIFLKDLNFRFSQAKDLGEKPLEEILLTLELWMIFLHKIFLKESEKISPKFLKIKKIISELEKAQILLNFTNVNKRLLLENLMLHF